MQGPVSYRYRDELPGKSAGGFYDRPKVEFQFMSDLHLEVGQQYSDFYIPPKAPYLILAGDIGRLKDYQAYLGFLRRQCASFTKVFLILGNHEFFGVGRAEGLELALSLENEPGCHGRLHILNQSRVDLDTSDITILGCTLHSNIPPDAQLMIQMKVSDFSQIVKWTVADHNAEHERDVAWLHQEINRILNERPRRRIMVITHHAPTVRGTCKPEHVGSPVGSAFSTELLSTRALANVQWWIFGHTHHSTKFKRRGVHLISNQRGYVLDGVSLDQRVSGVPPPQPVKSRARLLLFGQLLGMKGKPELDYDVEKVIELSNPGNQTNPRKRA